MNIWLLGASIFSSKYQDDKTMISVGLVLKTFKWQNIGVKVIEGTFSCGIYWVYDGRRWEEGSTETEQASSWEINNSAAWTTPPPQKHPRLCRVGERPSARLLTVQTAQGLLHNTWPLTTRQAKPCWISCWKCRHCCTERPERAHSGRRRQAACTAPPPSRPTPEKSTWSPLWALMQK